MEVARSAYSNGDEFDLEPCFHAVTHYGLLEWHVYVVYVGDGDQGVAICGVLTFYEL